MGTVYRFKAQLDGFVGGPGQNTWHICQAGELGGADASDLEGVADDIRSFYTGVSALMAEGVTVDISPVVEGFDIATGNLTEVTGITPPLTVTAPVGPSDVARATQIAVRLRTDAIRGNRLLAGRLFIGPINRNAITDDGQIEGSAITSVTSAFGGLLDLTGNGRLVVWGQPDTVPSAPAGVIGYVQSVVPSSTPGTLRSRKI